MHFCTAFVAIAGDPQQIVFRGLHAPISWPEIEVIRVMHGDDAVREAKPFVQVEQSIRAEKERLGLIYGEVVDKQVYPGRNPRMELDAPDMTPLSPGTPWFNPITGMVETTPGTNPLSAAEDEIAEATAAPVKRHRKRSPSTGAFLPDSATEPELKLDAD